MSLYLRFIVSWLAALTKSNRLLAPHPQRDKADSIHLPEVELEMDFVGGSVPESLAKFYELDQITSTNTGLNAASSSGHSRSKSESSALPRNSDWRSDLAPNNTLPRARARGNRNLPARPRISSSYAPVLVVPGIVNSSFFLFPPEPKSRTTAENTTFKRRRSGTGSFSEKHIEEERTAGRSNLISKEEEKVLASESSLSRSDSSSSSRSRSSFDSFGSQSSYTSDSSDERDDTEECSHRHRVPRILEGD